MNVLSLFLLLPFLFVHKPVALEKSFSVEGRVEPRCTKAIDSSSCGACPLLTKTKCVSGNVFTGCISGSSCGGACKADSGQGFTCND